MNKFVYLVLSVFLFTSCVSTIQTVNSQNDLSLKEDEGFVLLRVINPNARRVVDEFFDGDGVKVNNKSPLFLNSDLTVKRALGSFSELLVTNTEAPVQIIILKAKKGSYGIIKVGNNSEYFNPYVFKVDSGVINYVGDIKLDIVNGRVLKWREILDYYDLSVEDNFSEIQKSKNTSAFLIPYSDYEFVNQSKITSKMKPLHCHIIRED